MSPTTHLTSLPVGNQLNIRVVDGDDVCDTNGCIPCDKDKNVDLSHLLLKYTYMYVPFCAFERRWTL